MDTKNFSTSNAILIILIILGAGGLGGAVYYYGVKETPSTSIANQSVNQAGTPSGADSNLAGYRESPSAETEVVWPSNQQLGTGTALPPNSTMPPSSSPTLPVSQPSAAPGNQVLDTYLNAYQKVQQNKESYKEVSFRATIYTFLPLRDFLDGLDITINPAVYQYLDQSNYRAVFCYRDANTVDRGLILHLKPGSTMAYYEKLYYGSEGIEPSLKQWEPTMFSDLKNIFFPDNSLPSQYAARFQTTPGLAPVEYATLKDQQGKTLFVGYCVAADEALYLANSLECQGEILKANAPAGEP